jgi:hypothetical protein
MSKFQDTLKSAAALLGCVVMLALVVALTGAIAFGCVAFAGYTWRAW